ncbi:MAG: septation protein SpoVG family protein [Planctomycetota bacterium]
MEITEVRVKLVEGASQDKLKAFCSITIDGAFVVRDLKVIEGTKGLFVAMPSRKLTARCQKCGAKNQVRSNYCSDCGYSMAGDRGQRAKDARIKLHADIAHPINAVCREVIQARVLKNYQEECDAALRPDYAPKSFDDYEGLDDAVDSEDWDESAAGNSGVSPAPQPLSRTGREVEPLDRGRRDRSRQDHGRSEPEPVVHERPRPAASQPATAASRPSIGALRPNNSPRPNRAAPPDDNFGSGIF